MFKNSIIPTTAAMPSLTYTTITIVIICTKIILSCRVSEFPCRGGLICLPLDKYCDGRDDCGDASDEPKFCTVCNRTYYGDVGRTYSLRVPPFQWNRLPFLCHLTFTASGHDQGDIVQIIFDDFSVGRFDEGLIDSDSDVMVESSLSPVGDLPGCPEGFMQLSELGRPFTGGSWCGIATGHQLYYSETSTVTASVKVFHAPLQAATPFRFKIRYKFIRQSDAVVRYGPPSEHFELGRVTPGTYCTRQFDECYRKNCRLQSPNYPGMYPRNVTCYWTIKQKNVPTCKHAMVAVGQENEQKALVKRSIASLNKTSKSVRAWSECTGERDHLIFYDGSSTNDPVLAKYCGGDWLPRVVSRGSEMLVAFHSSPFSAPLESDVPYRGFELDVDIHFADSDSYDFSNKPRDCEFYVNASNPDEVYISRRGRMGKILSPRHTLPPNTTCTYYFYGFPTDLIWIYFTSYNLQILQQPSVDNTTFGRVDYPPWITRFRIWDSNGTNPYNSSHSPNAWRNTKHNYTTESSNYYYYAPKTANSHPQQNQQQQKQKPARVNVDNVWNPVDTQIYGPTSNTIFDRNNKYAGMPPAPTQKQDRYIGNGISLNTNKETFSRAFQYNTNTRKPQQSQSPQSADRKELTTMDNLIDAATDYTRQQYPPKHKYKYLDNDEMGPSSPNHHHHRKLIVELFDNETPKLCDHSAMQTATQKLRPCSLLESYISAGRDMKIEFHSQTGTALFPATFSLNYEFVDTDLGGELWTGRKGEDTPPPMLCSRVFRNKKGEFHSPRDVFLHGRGGAKNITCFYRFEANLGERVRFVLHNISFGESATCITETDYHTGRPKCTPADIEPETRISELRIFDVPFRDVKIPLGCFCDNTTSVYNIPLTFQSNSRTLEITFTVTRLNVSEDFNDVYFHASYEMIRIPDCSKQMQLKGSGGESELQYPFRPKDSTCEGHVWYIEAQQNERSLFVLTWGTHLPVEPTSEDAMRCNTRNRLIVYSGRPLKIMRVICPTQPQSRSTTLHIFSEDWMNVHPPTVASKPVGMVLEPIFREIGSIGFSWLEIQRTKASLIQQMEIQTNFTANETLGDFLLDPKTPECMHKCPELNACISSALWCDGRPNCPSGFDETEEECGPRLRLLEMPGGLFAALGCLAAALSACLLFCLLGLVRKRKKYVQTKSTSSNGILKKDLKKDSLFIDPGS